MHFSGKQRNIKTPPSPILKFYKIFFYILIQKIKYQPPTSWTFSKCSDESSNFFYVAFERNNVLFQLVIALYQHIVRHYLEHYTVYK